MNKKILMLSICLATTSCSIHFGKKENEGNIATSIDEKRIERETDTISFGTAPTIWELAQEKGIPENGGIKRGRVVVVPTKDEWDARLSNEAAAILHIRSIEQGNTIAEASQHRSEGRVRLAKGYIPTIPLSDDINNEHCKVIMDNDGLPITIRPHETGFNRYGFYHELNNTNFMLGWRRQQLAEAERLWNQQAEFLDQLKARFESNKANDQGQCVTIEQRPIPPEPKRIDPKLVEMNAHGACVTVLGSRFTQEQVIDALESAGRWNITNNFQTWSFGEKLTCSAGVTISEFESLKTRAIDWLAPKIAKDYFRDAIRRDINTCVSNVKHQCNHKHASWERERAQIIAQPQQLKTQCEEDKQAILSYNYTDYHEAKALLEKAQEALRIAQIKFDSYAGTTIVPFTDKRTYCQ